MITGSSATFRVLPRGYKLRPADCKEWSVRRRTAARWLARDLKTCYACGPATLRI